MFDPKRFSTVQAKPLPVFMLLDVSGSMKGEKLDNLNKAVFEMINDFQNLEIPITLSTLLFGSASSIHINPTSVNDINWVDLTIDCCRSVGRREQGITPMGVSFKDLKKLIEDKKTTPSRAYRPLLLLVSDGKPNKGWQQPLNQLISNGRSSKCDRMAMAIGKDANHNVLSEFVTRTGNSVFQAKDASEIKHFFKLVTMSVTMRAQSKNPNLVPNPSDIKLDGNSVDSTPSNTTTSFDDDGYW